MHYYQLVENERYQIYIMNKAEHSEKVVYYLRSNPSMISRELRRKHGLQEYWPRQAQRMSDMHKREGNSFFNS